MTDTAAPVLAWSLPLTAKVALVASFVWSLLLLVAAFTFPVYGYSSSSAAADSDGNLVQGEEITGTATLVGANGAWAALVISIPLVVTIAVAVLLRIGARPARVVAWTVTSALAALTVLGLMSIGLFILPATVALVVACASAGKHRALTLGE